VLSLEIFLENSIEHKDKAHRLIERLSLHYGHCSMQAKEGIQAKMW
jgi:hypothetical protein